MKSNLLSRLLVGLVLALVFAPFATAQSKKPKKAEAKSKPKVVGPAIGENKATPVDRLHVADGFQAELLYSVPGQDQGSWVNLCVDSKGRILASDQYGGLYRITPPPPGKKVSPNDIQKVPADIRAVNGMAFMNEALYVGVNDYENKIPSGLYRITDSNGDDSLDRVELLREIEARGDHGVHAIVPASDGNSFFLVCGNGSKPTAMEPTSPVPQVWGEDHLLPRLPDGRGFMRDTMGPGGIIYRVSLDGKKFEAFASGFRNVFDAALNREGELFTYDADMEYDFNTSWYRPTRINHVVSGGEFGWRNGAGKRPAFYPDNLPAVIDIGPGSPTGVTFGYGAKFPAKYQNALYALDWSWGKLYAIHLEPDGATYTATKEEFVTGAPLPITDAVIHPGDGAMYFAIGGRVVQSGLYRVTYVGKDATNKVSPDAVGNKSHELRRKLEQFHGHQTPEAIATAWPYLSSDDRFIRWAARTAIEHQDVSLWHERAIKETNPSAQVEALMALARVAGVCPQHRTASDSPIDTAVRDQIIDSMLAIDASALDHARQLTFLRTFQIALNRFGRPSDAIVARITETLNPLFPAKSPETNWLLCETLAWLQSPTVAAKAIDLIQTAPTQEEQIEYSRSIRFLQAGWTSELRTAYFEWFLKAANYRGGASFEKFISSIRDDAVASLPAEDKAALAELLARKPEKISALENLGAIFADRQPVSWTLDELSAATKTGLNDRDLANGRKMFAAAGCYACHRFDNQGGMTGPDLTSAGRRYSSHDFLDQIINPSKVINDQFSSVMVLCDDGKIHTGVVVNLSGDSITLNTDLSDPNQRITVDRKTVEELEVSKISPMPAELLNRMTKDEILDLVAYVLSTADVQ